jgi:hypothetical protein
MKITQTVQTLTLGHVRTEGQTWSPHTGLLLRKERLSSAILPFSFLPARHIYV